LPQASSRPIPVPAHVAGYQQFPPSPRTSSDSFNIPRSYDQYADSSRTDYGSMPLSYQPVPPIPRMNSGVTPYPESPPKSVQSHSRESSYSSYTFPSPTVGRSSLDMPGSKPISPIEMPYMPRHPSNASEYPTGEDNAEYFDMARADPMIIPAGTYPSLATPTQTITTPQPQHQQAKAESRSSAESARPTAVEIDPTLIPPDCPRSKPSRSYTDWYTPVNRPDILICPSCYKAVFQPSPFTRWFKPSAPVKGTAKCNFSEMWTRIAWVVTLQTKTRDLNHLYGVHSAMKDSEDCPGGTTKVGGWYTLAGLDDNRGVQDFNACLACVRCVEAVFPKMEGKFKFRRGETRSPNTCDLWPEGDSFVAYIAALERGNFEDYLFDRKTIAECTGEPYEGAWHMISSVPEFTVCEECYRDVVLPSELATKFSKNPQRVSGAKVCKLYPTKGHLRFKEACKRGDAGYLRI
jgi:hypothetical protein